METPNNSNRFQCDFYFQVWRWKVPFSFGRWLWYRNDSRAQLFSSTGTLHGDKVFPLSGRVEVNNFFPKMTSINIPKTVIIVLSIKILFFYILGLTHFSELFTFHSCRRNSVNTDRTIYSRVQSSSCFHYRTKEKLPKQRKKSQLSNLSRNPKRYDATNLFFCSSGHRVSLWRFQNLEKPNSRHLFSFLVQEKQ